MKKEPGREGGGEGVAEAPAVNREELPFCQDSDTGRGPRGEQQGEPELIDGPR